ncbi:TRAP transporter substrate-binding protein [Variovorax paradoxus]|uniref:TRAP transporter substrate-binding protein n=1 Tax=Variovorax paradoxus TaxID=34073 RepID=UPI0021AD0028|nr:TRAP transporter substrate-binding protein [Variovorax paradoxus]UVH57741.1 TRAP transporter substrate-binding protein [Variovorax paradoxus]
MSQPLITRRTFALLVGGAGAFSSAASAAPGATVWRLATGYPAENFHTVSLLAMAKEVERSTAGQLRIEVHAGNSLFALNAIRAAVQDGRIEAGEAIMSSLAADVPLAGADSVPFITSSYADAQRLWRIQRPLIEQAFAERRLRVLYAVAWPPQGLYSTKPLAAMSDLRGMRMRAYNATTARIATLMGAVPVDVPATELDRALADGRIDCMMTSAVTGVESRVWQSMRFFYEINAWFPKNLVFVNDKAWSALEATSRDALKAAAAAAELRGWANSAAAAARSMDELRRNGMKIEQVSFLFSRDLQRLGEHFSLDWVKQVGVAANGVFIPYFDKR